MDVAHARTLLAIVEAGSFKAAAERLHVTQSTVSARVRNLEDQLGKRLLERSKAGVSLTSAGEQFIRHATAMVRIWTQAQLEVAVSETHQDHVAVGGQLSLWDGLLLPWVSWIRTERRDVAVTARVGSSIDLVDQLFEGTLDIAAVYRSVQRPGLVVEHVFDEELVLVTSGDPGLVRNSEDYVFVNWGPEFAADHAAAFSDSGRHAGLRLDLGALGIAYLLENRASGYFPRRIAAPLVAEGRLKIVSRARRFVYPVYIAYPENRDSTLFDPLFARLREIADSVSVSA